MNVLYHSVCPLSKTLVVCGESKGLRPNLKFSIYRDRAKDNVTLYPNKNNSVKSELSQIYITAEGYTPQTTKVVAP